MIDDAYRALAVLLAGALVDSGLIDSAAALQVDPSSVFTPMGDEETLVVGVTLMKVQTVPVRTLLGGPAPRYVVDRQCRLELAIAGPDRLRDPSLLAGALASVAAVPKLHPNLDGAAERVWIGERSDEDLPPNGEAISITFTIRVRSGDQLGCTA